MDSSPVLRQQSQNKIRSELTRTKNEHNKMPAHPKPSNLFSAHHLSNLNIENQDPVKSEMGLRAALRPGISRLPVLAKSLHLQTTSNFGLSNYKWEDKPLAGKTRKKKPYTRPVPFNFCQPKSSRLGHENQEPCTVSQSRTGTDADNGVCNYHLKTQNVNAKPIKHPAALMRNIDLTKGTGTFKGKAKDNALQTSATLFKPQSSIPNNAVPQSKEASSAEPAVSAEACSDNMSLLSLKDPAKTSHATQNMQLTAQDPLSKSSTDKGDNFQSDHAALLSILRDEGLSATGLGSTTPHSKLYNNLPQRVSALRSRHKLGPISGLMKSVQFSPDVAALQSILQNEGVKAGGPLGATPRIPVCPGRGTSVIHPKRVPVTKNRAEATEGPVVLALKETPQKQWTPQRVPCTRNRPMSAMKWPLSSHRSSFAITPGLQRCKSTLKPQKEEIVQRLFYDQEEEHPGKPAEQLPTQNATAKVHHEVKVEASGVGTDKDEEEEQRIVGGQPFFQAPQRESVIFFSTGKTLLRAPRFEKQENSVRHDEHGPVLPVHEETRPVSACQINPAQSLHKDLISQKPSTPSSAVALLRKRLLAPEELRMDEEVASYCSVPNAPCLLPPRPRCGNPLAYTLHFQESFTFLPIGFDLLSGCSSPSSSPLQER
ncbi:uncharacterized protein troap [Pseudochaenichthys georgianus]|uniref:uncharacterized protein troap n=1 Tax=Pseudochaenichthys georgianus TaxID=52239 RepID=UPI00146B1C18|nr:uncharacterized protein troap [Pseudochaenichthys georgianus]